MTCPSGIDAQSGLHTEFSKEGRKLESRVGDAIRDVETDEPAGIMALPQVGATGSLHHSHLPPASPAEFLFTVGKGLQTVWAVGNSHPEGPPCGPTDLSTRW